MNTLLLTHIQTLVIGAQANQPFVAGPDMQHLTTLDNAYLLAEGGKVVGFGPMEDCPERADTTVDAKGGWVFPAWCDSHTHLVFAASREGEFVDRIRGMSYEEIASRGGGILNSAARLRDTPEEVLYEQALARLRQVQAYGTGAIEIKSGYGLSLEGELKMLRVIRRLKEVAGMPVKATFLGAHALPLAYRERREEYLRLIVEQMLPHIAGEGLADYIDVFCEKGFFSVEETTRLMETGAKYGLKAKIHTNQFNCLGGIQAAVAHGARSVDHLEVVNEAEITVLQGQPTMPVLLPSASFFINAHYQPARRLIDAGLPVALATDYNPGSTPSGRMQFVLSLACIKCGMLPEEVVNAATINGAWAIELEQTHGSLAVGKTASFFITPPMPALAYLPYAFGDDLVERVFLDGQQVVNRGQ